MRLQRKLGVLAASLCALLAGCLLTAPGARAFSTQNNDVPDLSKFDLDEQLRNFRKGDSNPSSANKKPGEMPFGNGTLQFDVRQGSSRDLLSPGLGLSPGAGMEPAPRNSREDFNRVVTPENLR